MVSKVLVLGLVMLCVVGCIAFINSQTQIQDDKKVYSGPVRITDDEDYFRKTGITIPMEVKA